MLDRDSCKNTERVPKSVPFEDTNNSGSIYFIVHFTYLGPLLKGTSGRKKSLAQMKEREKCKKRAIPDLNAPNGSRDIPLQSLEFEQYGHRHFVDFSLDST